MTTTVSLNAPAIDTSHLQSLSKLDVPARLLLGPGPSNADPAVLAAMDRQPIGHLDKAYLQLMDEVQELMRYTWQTDNRMTLPVSGTGSAAMEATFANVIEPGDKVMVCVNGYFGYRMMDMAGRYGAEVSRIDRPWGEVFTLADIRQGLEANRPKIMSIVHAETSTGVCQPMEGIGDLCREYDCLLILDTVTSMGGVPLFIDKWKVDLAYSCSQKGLSCPPGSSPFTMGDRALDKLKNRSGKVANWYLDMSLLANYWGQGRTYHHTAPVNMTYAIREALRIIAEEGLAARWQRHQDAAERLYAGLADMGLECHVPREYRLHTLTTIRIPEGVDGKQVTARLIDEYNMELGGGLGDLAGQVWRCGLMGYNATAKNVDTFLSALKQVLNK